MSYENACICGHRSRQHSVVTDRCLAFPRCACLNFQAAPSEEVGRTIPSRHSDPGTSHAAAQAITIRAGSQRARLLAAFLRLTDATDDEAMAAAEGVSQLSCYWKRCSELREGGFIRATGETRLGSAGMMRIVCEATEKARTAVQ